MFTDIRWAVHDEHISLVKEENGHGTIVTKFVPKLLVIRAHKDFLLVSLSDVGQDALIGIDDASSVTTRQLDRETRLFQSLFAKDIFAQILKLTHYALSHEHKRLVLKNLRQLMLDVNRLFTEEVEEIAVEEDFVGSMELVDKFEEVDVLVVLLSSLDSHFNSI